MTAVDELLVTVGAAKCRTCVLPNVADIDRAVARFVDLRARGSFGEWEWDVFVAWIVRDRWQYPLGPAALRRHSEGCRGLALPP